VYLPFQSKVFSTIEGETYADCGIEIKISNMSSDYISNYLVILVKPTVQNYMFTQFRYTKVSVPLSYPQTINISSGLINKTNEYGFTYTQVTHPSFNEPQLEIQTSTQSKGYLVFAGETISDFDIETRVYKIESGYMVIYVKPLY
jgi:hypothetical protein